MERVRRHALSVNASRYVAECRGVTGRAEFEQVLSSLRDDALRTAIYGADAATRDVHAGRAQAWAEICVLLDVKFAAI